MELYNVDFELCAVILLIVFFISFLFSKPIKNDASKAYIILVVLTIITTVLDIATAIMSNRNRIEPINDILIYSMNIEYFLLIIANSALFFQYMLLTFGRKDLLRGVYGFLTWLPIILGGAITISTPYTQWIFYFDDQGVYTRGPLYSIVVWLPYVYMLLCAIATVHERKKVSATKINACIIYIALLAICGIAQVVFLPHVLLTTAGACAGAIILYFAHQAPDAYYLISEVESLKKSKHFMEKQANEKETFFGTISHEIKNPIHVIMGMNELILEETKQESVAGYAEQALAAGQTLQVLLNDILDFTKIGTGNMKIVEDDYELEILLNDLVALVYSGNKSDAIEFRMKVSQDIPSVLYGDRVRIHQVIMNLLTNALKYTNEGSITLSVYVEPLEEQYVALHVEVEDTGIGIPKEEIETLFSVYKRVDAKRVHSAEGVGLGLFIVQQLLNLMGSSLQVESTYGKGSKFYFAIKQKVISEAKLGDYESRVQAIVKSKKHVARRMAIAEELAEDKQPQEPVKTETSIPENKVMRHDGKTSVLVVDDSPANLIVLQGQLKAYPVEIVTAKSGAQAIELYKQKPFDLVLLDRMMPQMSGDETLAYIREIEEEIGRRARVIMVTGNSKEEVMKEGDTSLYDGFLEKPVVKEELDKVLAPYI